MKPRAAVQVPFYSAEFKSFGLVKNVKRESRIFGAIIFIWLAVVFVYHSFLVPELANIDLFSEGDESEVEMKDWVWYIGLIISYPFPILLITNILLDFFAPRAMIVSSGGINIKKRLRVIRTPINQIDEVWVSGKKKESEVGVTYEGEIAWCAKKSAKRVVYYFVTSEVRQYRKLFPILAQWEEAGVRVIRTSASIPEVDG